MSQAKVPGPPWGSAPPRSEFGGGLTRKWPEHLNPGHIRDQSFDDVSGGSGLNTSPQGLSQPRVARMSQAKVPGPPWGSAPPRSEFGGGLTRKWPEHLNPGHIRDQSFDDVSGGSGLSTLTTSGPLATQSCEDVSGKGSRAIIGQGTSEVRVRRMSQAKVA